MMMLCWSFIRRVALAIAATFVALFFTARALARVARFGRFDDASTRWVRDSGVGLFVPTDVPVPGLLNPKTWVLVFCTHILYLALRSYSDRKGTDNGLALLTSALVWQRFALQGAVRRPIHLAILSVTEGDGCFGGTMCRELIRQRTISARFRAVTSNPFSTPRCGCTAPPDGN